MKTYDLIVIGSGASGMISAIISARAGNKTLLLEKLPTIASKLKATGGGRCNVTNTLSNEEFMQNFGRDGRFMQDALKIFDHKQLIKFLKDIGVETHAPDGFRIFPTSHSSSTIIKALKNELLSLGVTILCNQKVIQITQENQHITGVKTVTDTFISSNVILATGGLGYPSLGAEGDGHKIASILGHKITTLYPAMMPLHTKENWGANCRADTLAKVTIKIAIKKYKKLSAQGDLIFTKNGLRGPLILDFAREITPLLEKYNEVPILLNFTKGMNEEQIAQHLKQENTKDSQKSIHQHLITLLPSALSYQLLLLAQCNPDDKYKNLQGASKLKLIQLLAWTPLTINGHDGFKMAMITRGGINLKEINPKTMQSRLIQGLYFCGEIINIDGPCGGYNLQWSFSSGYLAGKMFI